MAATRTRRKADTTTDTTPGATDTTTAQAPPAPDSGAQPTPDPQPAPDSPDSAEAGQAPTAGTPNLQVMMVAAVLDAHPDGITGANLATASGLQPGVVAKVLTAMEATGAARRIPPPDETGVESWARGDNTDLAVVDPAKAPTHTECPTCGHKRRIVVNVGGARRNGNGEAGVNGDGAAKFRKNELYNLVRDFITTQPGHVFTHGDIARELSQRHGREISSGAVRNNVDRLLNEGAITGGRAEGGGTPH